MSISSNVKKIFLKLISSHRIAPLALKISLKIHNISYQLAGILSTVIEPNGLHPKHRLTRYHDWFLKRLKPEWHVIDIGCGNGALAFDIKSSCRSVLAIDIEKKNIEVAKGLYSKDGVSYVCADALTYDFENKFHAIILSNVLEHIENRIEFLKSLYKNKNQIQPPILLLRVPMITRDWISMYKKEIGVEWRLDHSHYTEYTLKQVFDELNQAGLTVESYDVQFGEFYGVIKRISG